jgi:hypothetical protein
MNKPIQLKDLHEHIITTYYLPNLAILTKFYSRIKTCRLNFVEYFQWCKYLNFQNIIGKYVVNSI